MANPSTRGGCIVLLVGLGLVACQRDPEPLEQLPPIHVVEEPLLPVPPPPPPPPRSKLIGPPSRVAEFVAAHAHREAPCQVSITARRHTIRLSPDQADAFIEHLGRHDAWTDGKYGCVSEDDTVRISCGRGEPLTFLVDCGTVKLDGPNGAEHSWSESMNDWYIDLCSKQHLWDR